MAFYPGLDIISLERFRATISLLLPASDVAAATRHFKSDPDPWSTDFRESIRSIQLKLLRRRIGQIFRRLRGKDGGGDDLLSRLQLESSEPGLTLVLHIGLGIPAQQLVHILGSSQYRVARDLLDVRLRLTGRKEHSCKIFLETLGCYRDGYVDLGLAASHSRHRVRCPTCDNLLRDFEILDDRILAEIQAIERSGVAGVAQPQSLVQRLVAAAPVVVIAVLLVGAIAFAGGFVGNLTGGNATPLYATTEAASKGDVGWIILGTWDGGLYAFDPETGRRHSLRADRNGTLVLNGANFLVSPSGERVAIFAQNPVSGLHWATRQIEIVSITGETENEIQLQQSLSAGWPTGWLNEREILLITVPVYEGGETTERYLERLEAEGRLRALDVTTGEQRALFRGAVAQVIPSPDGSRIAMVRPRDPREPGTTVDVWEIENGEIGDPISTVEHRFTWRGGLIWDENGDALYLGTIADFEEPPENNNVPDRDGEFRGVITAIDILRIDRDGSQSTFVESASGTGARVAGASVATGDIIYRTFSLEEPDGGVLWRHSGDSGEREQLALPERNGSDELAHWQPSTGVLGYAAGYVARPESGEFMLMLAGDHYLGSDEDYHREPYQGYYLTFFDEDLNPSIASVLSSRRQVFPLRWVTEETLAEVLFESDREFATFGSPEPVDSLRSYVRLDEFSRLSPDGTALTMAESVRNTGRPFLWYPERDTGRWIAQRTEELAWYSDGHAVIGVTEVRSADSAVSRITQHSSGHQGGSSVDAFFDPAGLGESEHLRYAQPKTSTDATRTSFYVIDTERGRANLWISDWEHGARPVHGLRYSSRTNRLSPLTGLWLDERSFLFSQTLQWTDGMPIETALKRLTIDESGEATIERLVEIDARGRDRGVAIQEFAVDPDGDHIVYRLRHFTDRDNTREGYDTIHLATTNDVGQTLEIQRGSHSRGLTWSPSGNTLAFTIDERVGVYFLSDHRFEFATSAGRPASHPTWVSNNELWFNVGSGGNAEVRRVVLE